MFKPLPRITTQTDREWLVKPPIRLQKLSTKEGANQHGSKGKAQAAADYPLGSSIGHQQ
jgi:hypothetical protein